MQFLYTITHSQISLFSEEEPDFNLWSTDHVAQGFSWRAGHVSFGVPDHDGMCVVEVAVVPRAPAPDATVLRVLGVPMDVRDRLYVATTVDENTTDVPPGRYQIVYHLRRGDLEHPQHPHAFYLVFYCVRSDAPEFFIERGSGEMTSDVVLTREAEPAI